jgi:PAS domain S-box-containing protein
MKDSSKTKNELIEELSILKKKIKNLEKSEAQQKPIQMEMQESEHKYRQLAEDMPALICTFLPDSTLTYVNKAYCELFQKQPADLVGKKFLDFLPDEVIRENVRCQYLSLTPENPLGNYEHKAIVADRTSQHWHRWIDRAFFSADGQISHFQAIGQDITEQKEIQERSRENELRYRLLADNATDVIWVVGMDMRLTYVSPSVTRLLGFTVEEAIAQTMQQAFTPSAFEKAMQIFAEEMAIESLGQDNPSRSLMAELELVRKDGSTVPVEGHFCFLRDPTGKANGILSIARDITERKRMEEELLGKSSALEEVNTALKVFNDYCKKDQEELEERIVSNIRVRIIPYIEKLKQTRLDIGQSALIEIIERSFRDISSPFLKFISSEHFRFTPKEVEIVSLLREGKTTMEIAKILGIGKRTVDSYRDNIRSKLGLANKKVNLRTYLLSIHNT